MSGSVTFRRLVAAALLVLCGFGMPVAVLAQGAGLGAAGELVDPDILRVCADPSNMPFSDKNGQGFENKVAELVAAKTGRKSVEYTWYPMATGFVRNTLGANLCDIVIGYAQGDELVQNTNAYYRSTYVIIYKKDGDLKGVETLTDPRLSDKVLGIVMATPPSSILAKLGLMRRAHAYPLMIDTRLAPSMADVMLKDLISDKIDAAILWGPMAGYYAAKLDADLAVVPLVKEKPDHMSYRITMGVRPSDQEWKRTLNKVIRENQAEINAILLGFHVPLIDESNQPITK